MMMDEQMPAAGTNPEGGWYSRQAKGMDRRRYVSLLTVVVLVSCVLIVAFGALGYWWSFIAVKLATALVIRLCTVPLAVLRLRYLGLSAWGAGWLFLPLFGEFFLIVWAVRGLGKRKALAWGLGGAMIYLVAFGVADVVGGGIWGARIQPEFTQESRQEFMERVAELECDELFQQQLMSSPLGTANASNANAVIAGIQHSRPSDCGRHSWRPMVVQVSRDELGNIDVYFSPREGGVRWVYLSAQGMWYEGEGDGGLVPFFAMR